MTATQWLAGNTGYWRLLLRHALDFRFSNCDGGSPSRGGWQGGSLRMRNSGRAPIIDR